jgi:hypothetical protein
MGTVIKFPDEGRIVRFGGRNIADESATVIILPVIRIERYSNVTMDECEPGSEPPSGRRRRRPVRPS